MIGALIRRDGAIRQLPILGALLLSNAGLLLGLIVARVREGRPPDPALIAAIGWISVSLQLFLGAWKPRGGPFELALPIGGRTLWLSRVAALALSGGVVAVGYVLLVAAAPLRVDPGPLAALLLAATLLGAVLLQAPRPGRDRIRLGGWTAAGSGAVLVGILVLVVAGAPRAGTGSLLLVAGAGAALWIAIRRVPPALAVAPRRPESMPVAPAAESPAARRPGPVVLLQCLALGAQEVVALGIVALLGLVLGGGAMAWAGESLARDARMLYTFMGGYMLFAFVGPRLNRTIRLDPLPVARAVLFSGIVGPSLLMLGASYGAGSWMAQAHDRTEYVDFTADEEGAWRVSVPLRIHRLSRQEQPPVATAPWGESHPGLRHPLVRGGRAAAVTPYAAGPGASARFVAWQVAGAAEEVYGLRLAEEEILARLEVAPDGAVIGRHASLGLRAARPELSPRSGPMFPAIAVMTVVPWLLLSAVLFAMHRPGRAPWTRQAAYWGGLALLMLLFLTGPIGVVALGIEQWALRALVEIPMWGAGRTAGGTVLAWAAGTAAILAAALVAGRAFRRMEIPTRPTRYSILERLKEDSCS